MVTVENVAIAFSAILIIFLLSIPFFHEWRHKKDLKTKMPILLEALLRASTQKLEDAAKTLEQASFGFRNTGFDVPPLFWYVEDVSLMAKTLRTCTQIVIKKIDVGEQDHPVWPWLCQMLREFANHDVNRALVLAAKLSALDRGIAENFAKYIESAGFKRCSI